ncbi:BLUE LIGHT SIGNALING1 [Hibiscus trionum]|uniref:BLUE LIGHT SIGNALING1 n=1 Tax=Hibiscus trionum TaxID=183268 RepID=A0A9W7H3S5_HIBTR|nr:BLUE LIGHT SIGNALING1 [Hibiscus trionum]
MEYDNPRNQFPLDPSSYKITHEIAVGVGVVVYKAVCVPMDLAIVAIKAIDREQCIGIFDILEREAQSMILLSHPNLLRAHCSFNADRHVWVVMPFMSCGSLHSIISSSFPGGLPEECMAIILKETLKALSYLHNRGNIHGDVKPSNILLDSNGCVKLADLGASCSFYGRKSAKPHWVAPEIIKSRAVSSFETDIWSFGVTALVSTKTFSEAFQDIVTCCLDKDPAKRPSADELLKHPFFEGCKATSEFLVEHLLHGLPSVEQRFRPSKIVPAHDHDPHGESSQVRFEGETVGNELKALDDQREKVTDEKEVQKCTRK